MSQLPPPMILSRKPRRPGDAWDDATSWFGGRPRLGGRAARPWLSRPQAFLAPGGGGEIARRAGPSILPQRGALAFFVGAGPKRWEGAVLHIEAPGAPTDPPTDAP